MRTYNIQACKFALVGTAMCLVLVRWSGLDAPRGWRQRHCRGIVGRAMPCASLIEAGRNVHPLFIIESVAYAMHL